jgi:hypothetical protein
MKLKLDRIISIATLLAAVAAIVLVLKRPATVVQPQGPGTARTQSIDQKPGQLEPSSQQAPTSYASGNYFSAPPQSQQPASNSQTIPQLKADAHGNSDEVGNALTKMLGAAGAAGAGSLSPDANIGSGQPNIKDQQVTYEGDVVHGRFLTEIAGKDVWVTITGHMGSKDGYATFEPTEFKVGDTEVPVALVNPLLQKKLAEQRDRMKLPE